MREKIYPMGGKPIDMTGAAEIRKGLRETAQPSPIPSSASEVPITGQSEAENLLEPTPVAEKDLTKTSPTEKWTAKWLAEQNWSNEADGFPDRERGRGVWW